MKLRCLHWSRRGFSLVEMTAVVVLLAVLAGMLVLAAKSVVSGSLTTQAQSGTRAFNDATAALAAHGALDYAAFASLVGSATLTSVTADARFGGGNARLYLLSSPSAKSATMLANVLSALNSQLAAANLGKLVNGWDARQLSERSFYLVFVDSPVTSQSYGLLCYTE